MAPPFGIVGFSSLFPNQEQPQHGVFVAHRLHHVAGLPGVAMSVVAPVPWFPWRSALFGRYGRFARVPSEGVSSGGLHVRYPRHLVLPKVGTARAAAWMASGAERAFRLAASEVGAAVVDAHYLYPDGVAAARLAREAGLPLVLTARGSDVNVLARESAARSQILAACEQAVSVVAVSGALARELVAIGVAPAKVKVIRNGVDLSVFHPAASGDAGAGSWRSRLGFGGPMLVCVGKFDGAKGQDVAIRQLRFLPDAHLMLVGAGGFQQECAALATAEGVAGRVHFLGTMSQSALASLYAEADVALLPSLREGMPNVVLEALACGTPVVATDVGGIAEVLNDASFGVALPGREPSTHARAVAGLLQRPPPRDRVREAIRELDWHRSSLDHLALLQAAAGRAGS